jgi:hypothetical protein
MIQKFLYFPQTTLDIGCSCSYWSCFWTVKIHLAKWPESCPWSSTQYVCNLDKRTELFFLSLKDPGVMGAHAQFMGLSWSYFPQLSRIFCLDLIKSEWRLSLNSTCLRLRLAAACDQASPGLIWQSGLQQLESWNLHQQTARLKNHALQQHENEN